MSYAFLSSPPPSQKKQPTQPLPPTPVKNYIAAWAAHVQPGSPTPRSPCPHRRSSGSSRRPSNSSFIHCIDTQSSLVAHPSRSVEKTPSIGEYEFDLTNLGYTSVFVHLPNTPSTPSPLLRKFQQKRLQQQKQAKVPSVDPDTFPIPSAGKSAGRMKRFRSLSVLRSRPKTLISSNALPPSPTKSLSAAGVAKSKCKSAKSKAKPKGLDVVKRKKALYAKAVGSSTRPPPLANELLLRQFVDGGKMDEHIQRVMEDQALAAAGSHATKAVGLLGVGDVYRDGKGGIWWDREEEMEYVGLLAGDDEEDEDEKMGRWVTFGGEDKDATVALRALADVSSGRRDSASSSRTQDSDLDPTNVVRCADENGMLGIPPSPPIRATTSKPPAVLSVPFRQRPVHLRKNPGFILDLAAFSVPSETAALHSPHSPLSPNVLLVSMPPSMPVTPCRYSPRTPHSATPSHFTAAGPKRTSRRISPVKSTFSADANHARRAAAAMSRRRSLSCKRRRPAPLDLGSSSSLSSSTERIIPVAVDVEMQREEVVHEGRVDFREASFAPASIPRQQQPPYLAVPELGVLQESGKLMKKKPSRLFAVAKLFGVKG